MRGARWNWKFRKCRRNVRKMLNQVLVLDNKCAEIFEFSKNSADSAPFFKFQLNMHKSYINFKDSADLLTKYPLTAAGTSTQLIQKISHGAVWGVISFLWNRKQTCHYHFLRSENPVWGPDPNSPLIIPNRVYTRVFSEGN